MASTLRLTAVFAALLVVGCSSAEPPSDPTAAANELDIRLSFDKVASLPFGLQSFAYGMDGDRVLLVGGRRNGLHGSSYDSTAFALSEASDALYVFNRRTLTIEDSIAVSRLGAGLDGWTFRTNNAQFVQLDTILYVTGGLVAEPVTGDNDRVGTLDRITAINLPGVIDAIVARRAPPANSIRQAQDSVFEITGGELFGVRAGNVVRLLQVFGWQYSFYTGSNAPTNYSHQITTIGVTDDGTTMTVDSTAVCATCSDGFSFQHTDSGTFRRRDGVMGPVTFTGTRFPQVTYYGGVFKDGNTAHTTPVHLTTTSAAENTSGFAQVTNNYTSAIIPMSSRLTDVMTTAFLGGMSNISVQPWPTGWPTELVEGSNYRRLHLNDTTFSHLPFTRQVSFITQSSDGAGATMRQYLNPDSLVGELGDSTGFIGANSVFVPGPGIPIIPSSGGVLDLDSIVGTARANGGSVVIGHLVGGILSNTPDLLFETGPGNRISTGNPHVYAVTLTVRSP